MRGIEMKSNFWAAYEPTPADPWDLRKVAHLHRRACFGPTWAELERDLKDGPAASVERLLHPPEQCAELQQIEEGLRQGALQMRASERLKAYWLYRILHHPDQLREKMTLFWHGHFATSLRKVGSVVLMHRQNELLRQHALGEFGSLLSEIARDPAMLIWLDGADSKKNKPNENFAREYLELFSLGIGHYSETDIREAARAFTGWQRVRNPQYRGVDEFPFDPKQADGGSKTFLKKTGPWDADAIVRLTLEQPACAEFLCRKLYRYFISETSEPAPEVVQELAEELRRPSYNVGAIVALILRSRQFFAAAANRQKIKSPIEFAPGLVRALEVSPGSARLLAMAAACDRQGQELYAPPNVKGWDGGRTWLNSTTVLERGNWIADVLWGNAEKGMPPYDPLAWAERYHIAPEHVAETMIDLLLQGDLDPKARELVIQVGADGRPDSLRKAIQLVLHCPDYQLA
jgi:uncharacterized protein (DUF1800 family)